MGKKIIKKDLEKIMNYCISFTIVLFVVGSILIGLGLAHVIISSTNNIVWKSYSGLAFLILGVSFVKLGYNLTNLVEKLGGICKD